MILAQIIFIKFEKQTIQKYRKQEENILTKMSDNTQKLQAKFNRANMNRNNIRTKLNRTLYDLVSFMQTKIRKQLKTFTLLSICGGQRSNFVVNSYFQNSFQALTLQQKVDYFQKTVNFIRKFEDQKQNNQVTDQKTQLQKIKNKYGSQVRFIIQINSGFRSWDQQTISLSGFKISSSKKINIDLRNYLMRKSKKKQVSCYVLQAIKTSKPQTIRFCFKRKQQQNKYIQLIYQLIDLAYFDYICKQSFNGQMGIMKKNQKTGKTAISLQQSQKFTNRKNSVPAQINYQLKQKKQILQTSAIKNHQVSVSYELMRSKDEQQLREDLKDLIDYQNEKNPVNMFPSQKQIQRQTGKKLIVQKKNYLNIFSIMLPNYVLNQLDSLNYYDSIYSQNSKGMCIYKNRQHPHRFKMELSSRLSAKTVLMILYNVQLYKNWNENVKQGQLKFRISSQNCAIFYQKHASFSKWYRQRDFLYLKHVFQLKGNYFLVDKSFQNTNFIPFNSIQRGIINHCVTRISQTQKGCQIMIDVDINHSGLLKQVYQEQLTFNYLKGLANFEQHFQKQQFKNQLSTYFYHNWNIQQTLINQSSYINIQNLKTQDFNAQQINNKSIDQSQLYFSVDDLNQSDIQQALSQHQILEQEIIQKEQHMKQTWSNPPKINLDKDGRIIIPQKYLKKKHIKEYTPYSNQRKRIQKKFQNIILQDNWAHMKTGGLQIINQKKIQAQNNVFGFIMKKLKQNLFSGKGLTNISLPVQVFNCDSNLSRVCKGFSLAPQFLQKAFKAKDSIQRMKYTMLFGLSCSLFYLDAQKPFNPILGQTYQGVIDGCPVYAQQISHHPPISSFYMIGRGYKIYGGVQAKVNLHLNSADGLNEGFTNVQFDDGQIITFSTPAGQVSNTTMGGNRQFNFLGRGYYYDLKNKLFAELIMQQQTGLFSKGKWKYRDQVEGHIYKVKDSYMNKVVQKIKDKKSPSDKQIQETYDKLQGRWLFEVLWDNELRYKTNEDLPFEIQNYQYPLPSDCFYRQDIYYRIMQDLARSQIQKQRLQVLQRGDRKFRQKYHKSSH